MSRTADEARRAELLDRAVDYVTRHGLADLSLRPLAKAVRSSPRGLLYYFGSKEELIVEIIRRGRTRQRAMMADLKLGDLPPREVARLQGCEGAHVGSMWKWPENERSKWAAREVGYCLNNYLRMRTLTAPPA